MDAELADFARALFSPKPEHRELIAKLHGSDEE
jgi:hypothetical protein